LRSGTKDAKLTVTCEVAGHPATQVTYEETAGGVFVTNQKIELADNQVLLIAVHQNIKGRQKLLGEAPLHMEDMVTGGFEGQLKLQRRGRSVPIQMSAKVPTPDDKKFEPPTPEDKKSEPHVEKATSSEDFVLEVQNVAEEVGPVIPESESQSEDNVEVEGPK
ncbi:unnamed protein product, partial [Effrenium voratum]